MDRILEIMRRRFACKLYAKTPLLASQLDSILEAGRLSPTSFGLEGWHFHVVLEPSLIGRLGAACFDQESVATAPVNIVITALRSGSYDPLGEFVAQRGSRFPGTLREFIDDYEGYRRFLEETGRTDCWSRAQCYIACANMMTAAAAEGIQSCAIEGFDEQQVAEVLGLDLRTWQVALVIPFGFPAEPTREKIREPIDRLVTYH